MECKKIIQGQESLQTIMEQYQKVFKDPIQRYEEDQCPICFMNFQEKKFKTVFSCGHIICTDCASSMIKVICPIGKCSNKFSSIQNGFLDPRTNRIYKAENLSRDQQLELIDIYTNLKVKEIYCQVDYSQDDIETEKQFASEDIQHFRNAQVKKIKTKKIKKTQRFILQKCN